MSPEQILSEAKKISLLEQERQQKTINLIPSENIVSEDVSQALCSPLMNKYSEGYPNKRYYQGNEFADKAELLAINTAKKLFGCEHVNVQPLSGSPANLAVFLALLNKEDTILGMDLSCGGHLTHGSKVNFSGKLFNAISYGVDKNTSLIDYDKLEELAVANKPKLIISGASAYPRIIDFKRIGLIAQKIGAYHLADISHIAGLVVAGLHPSPVQHADVIVTTTHKTLRGPRGAIIMCKKALAKKIDKAVFPGVQGGPHMNSVLAKAICFSEALKPEFKDYQKQVIDNAKALAGRLNKRKIPLITGGTDNHLILINLLPVLGEGKGRETALLLEEAGIIVNANTIPFDPAPPYKPSGIRIGTPFVTSQGLKEDDVIIIADMIADLILGNKKSFEIREQVSKLLP